MKRKFLKLLTSGFVGLTALTPLTITTSCSKDKVYSNNVKDSIAKLVEMNKHARCTTSADHCRHYLDQIRNYIAMQAIEAGINFDDIFTDGAGNLWFDVPASEGCESYEPLILQGHMDMVVAGLEEDKKATTPIDVDVDWKNGVVHSKNYKTSLGADDGIGVAIALTLIQDKSIKHGPIRCLFTANEDSGMIGAEAIWGEREDKKILEKMGTDFTGNSIKCLLNIDAEEEGAIYRSCAGSVTYEYKFSRAIETAGQFENTFTLSIDGLKGGHSGIDLAHDRANAEKCIFEILWNLADIPSKSFQIVKHYHPKDGKDISFARNQIVPYATIVFHTDATADEIQAAIDELLPTWKTTYKAEDWNSVKINVTKGASIPTNRFLNHVSSAQLIKLFGRNTVPTSSVAEEDMCIWYGYVPGDGTDYKYCANISPLNIYEKDDEMFFEFNSQTRMIDTDVDMPNYNFVKEYYSKIKIDDQSLGSFSDYQPWVRKDSNKMVEYVQNAYEKSGVKSTLVDTTGGVEPSWWCRCNDLLYCACIGPRIDNAHSTQETLYIDTIQGVIDATKYVMEAMKDPIN